MKISRTTTWASASKVLGIAAALALGADAAFRAGSTGLGAALGAAAVLATLVAFPTSGSRPQASRRSGHSWGHVRLEMDRACRTDGSLVVSRFSLTPTAARDAWALTSRIEHTLRGSDEVWCEGRSLYLLMPGADRATSAGALERAGASLEGQLAERPRTACFPTDALTVGGIIDVLHPPRSEQREANSRRVTTLTPIATSSVASINLETDQQATA